MHFWHTIAADNENDTDNVNENDIEIVIENENDIYNLYFLGVVIIFEKEIIYPVCG